MFCAILMCVSVITRDASANGETDSPQTPVFQQNSAHKPLTGDRRVAVGDVVHHIAGRPVHQNSDTFLTPKASAFPMRQRSPSLQIVNPETLGVPFSRKRPREGQESPFTPWEWQLQAFIRCALFLFASGLFSVFATYRRFVPLFTSVHETSNPFFFLNFPIPQRG